MELEKKIWPEYFSKVFDGTKKFEARLADFEVNPGDVLVLREWDPATGDYTGREIRKAVGYVLKTKDLTFWTDAEVAKHGYQIIGFGDGLVEEVDGSRK
ncbi:DUF3850 domain-containing protein [archaeon]|jgi:hypothetical protein|nr:DUF3850 domain-containing protein [archaeon]MBT3577628.1 DUF3850 domain-containing protein [archaeon]MBT6819906.1 DUF3850 domain-containing protein [archaeon]MBT6956684.1 DUF3850 domain-containing protein [archaeon]MBT7025062.1 DUF3850 domain-containing protein [archaeon]